MSADFRLYSQMLCQLSYGEPRPHVVNQSFRALEPTKNRGGWGLFVSRDIII